MLVLDEEFVTIGLYVCWHNPNYWLKRCHNINRYEFFHCMASQKEKLEINKIVSFSLLPCQQLIIAKLYYFII